MTTEKSEEEFEIAKNRCAELVNQCYWERQGTYKTDYNSTGFFGLLKIINLKPSWWGSLKSDGIGNAAVVDPELKIEGHVELLWLPLLPTLVKMGNIDSRAIGPVGAIPQHISLKVKRVTRQHARGTVESWFAYENNLVVPFTVTAAPVLCFHESLEYFDDLRPSTPERFESAIKLILQFVKGTQDMLSDEVRKQLEDN